MVIEYGIGLWPYDIENGGALKTLKKITVDVPESLLIEAQSETGTGISETVRKGLELLAAKRAYRNLRKLKGKVKFSLTLDEMRGDD